MGQSLLHIDLNITKCSKQMTLKRQDFYQVGIVQIILLCFCCHPDSVFRGMREGWGTT